MREGVTARSRPACRRAAGGVFGLLALLGLALALGGLGSVAAGASRPAFLPYVSVSPIPGTLFAEPHTQISVVGVPISEIGTWSFTGSKSGVHAGHFEAYSQGDGASFIPNRPFDPGEVVTVHTDMNVTGVTGHTYRFTIATPISVLAGVHGSSRAGDARRAALPVPALHVTTDKAGVAPGDFFFSADGTTAQDGLLVTTASGKVVWWRPFTSGLEPFDLREQTYEGQPVLTYWAGRLGLGHGIGSYYILNSSYEQVAHVRAGNGLQGDLHEFVLYPNGTALIDCYFPLRHTVHEHGKTISATVYDGVVQELDVKTGLVRFEWDSLDHVPIAQSYVPFTPPTPALPGYDYFHVNSAQLTANGDLLISARNTHAVYLVNPLSGRTVWQLGGTDSSWKMRAGTTFAWQHDAELHPGGLLTLFDDESSPPVGPQSRGLLLSLDQATMAVHLVRQYVHVPPLLTGSQGNLQELPDGNVVIGWGAIGDASEFSAAGKLLWDAHLTVGMDSYRTYQAPWTPSAVASAALDAHRAR